MKKILLLVVVLLLLGCSIKSEVSEGQEPEEVSIESKKAELSDLKWKRNMDCLNMKSEIEKKVSGKKSSYFGNAYLEQIFYSPKVGSCLYVEFSQTKVSEHKRLFDVKNDGYSSNPLESCTNPSAETMTRICNVNPGNIICRTCDEFNKKLKEYKK